MRCFIAFMFLCSTFSSYAQCWVLSWADEFNGNALDTTAWNYDTGCGWNNGELQAYTNRPENVSVNNGTLKIVARNESYNGCAYTSGRIHSRYKIDFQYGRFEARCKLPQGQGIWPAFWLMPTEGWQTLYGEIDIMELLGHQPAKTYGTCHAGVYPNLVSLGSSYTLTSGTFSTDFHILSVEWTSTSIKWYVDGLLYYSVLKSQYSAANWAAFKRDFFIILNVAVGGSWPGNPDGTTVFPQTMEVDYVRVYQQNAFVKIHGNDLTEPTTASGIYRVPAFSNATYQWSVLPDGQVLSGNSPNEARFLWNSNGTKTINCNITNSCGSFSRQKSVTVTPNQWANPSFEQLFANWEYSASEGGTATWATTTSNPQHLSRCAKVKVNTLGADPWLVQLHRGPFHVDQGVEYKLTYWAKANIAGKRIKVNFIHPTIYTVYSSLLNNLSTSWTQYTLIFTAPYTGNLLFTIDMGFDKGTYYLDNFVFGKSNLVQQVLIEPSGEAITSMEQQSAETDQIICFPNPARDIIFFDSKINGTYQFFDLMGNIVRQGDFNHEIDISDLPSGIYIYAVTQDKIMVGVGKFIKN